MYVWVCVLVFVVSVWVQRVSGPSQWGHGYMVTTIATWSMDPHSPSGRCSRQLPLRDLLSSPASCHSDPEGSFSWGIVQISILIVKPHRRSQPTVGDTIPRQVVLGCMRKLEKRGCGRTREAEVSASLSLGPAWSLLQSWEQKEQMKAIRPISLDGSCWSSYLNSLTCLCMNGSDPLSPRCFRLFYSTAVAEKKLRHFPFCPVTFYGRYGIIAHFISVLGQAFLSLKTSPLWVGSLVLTQTNPTLGPDV